MATGTSIRRRLRPVLGFLTVLLALLVVWESAKLIGGDRWKYDSFLGTGIAIDHDPPLTFPFATDTKLPHVWDIVAEFGRPDAAGATTAARLTRAGLFTLRNAAIGFTLGSVFGLLLAIVLVHVRTLERALVPLIVASQTIPIIAIAPLIVIGLKADWFGVAIVSTYLTFFPVTIAALRGLRAYDPRALELMRSYAASRGAVLSKLRLPAARPYLFTGFRIAAPAAVVGSIVGELPSLIQDGLARQIITGMQYYSLNAEYLWATIVASSVLGIGVYLLVVVAEAWMLRHERRLDAAAA
ncbi:MAG TPA: ABC transporter permease subunit [Candidatus Limnocylindrales bacterium]|nr:ABC transporter permease subunit [Candidatus Limnocylindrales bacterium]